MGLATGIGEQFPSSRARTQKSIEDPSQVIQTKCSTKEGAILIGEVRAPFVGRFTWQQCAPWIGFG